MAGPKTSYRERGLIPRTISHVFADGAAHPDLIRTIRMSYSEVYNEKIYDLLCPEQDPAHIVVTDGPKNNVLVRGMSAPVVTSEEEAFQLMFEGDENRAIGEHQLNINSSRSHAVLTLYLETRASPLDPKVTVSKLNLVDLAGSERNKKTKSSGNVAREATYINKSLTFLEQCVVALGDKTREHVPFRSSKLTHMLRDSLGGNAKTTMIANVWGEVAQVEETLSTCRFAQRMMRVQCDYEPNVAESSGDSYMNRALLAQIEALKEELAMHDMMSNRRDVVYEPYNTSQRGQVREQVRAFLADPGDPENPDSIAPLQILSVRHVREIMFAFRYVYRDDDRGPKGAGPHAHPHPTQAAAGLVKNHHHQETEDGVAGVGHGGGPDDDVGGMVAPSDARPLEMGVETEHGVGGDGSAAGEADLEGGEGIDAAVVATAVVARAGPRPSRADALADFQDGPGAERVDLLRANQQSLRESRARVQACGRRVNEAKRAIDENKAEVAALRAAREAETPKVVRNADDEEVEELEVGEEEYHAMIKGKELKATYRRNYQELQGARGEADYVEKLVEQCTRELALAFDDWYVQTWGEAPAEEEEEEEEGDRKNGAMTMAAAAAAKHPGGGGTTKTRGEGQGSPSKAAARAAFASPRKMTVADQLSPGKESWRYVEVPEEEAADPEASSFWSARRQLQQKMAARPTHFHHKPKAWGVPG
jgi:kinesin family member 6/9